MTWTTWKSPSANSVDFSGDVSWTNPSNAYADNSNDAVASAIPKNNGDTDTQKYTGFGFTTSDIPSGSTINGVEVRIDGAGSISDSSMWSSVRLYDATNGNSTQDRSGYWAASIRNDSLYGGASDLWGESSIDDADVRASTFGVLVKITNFSAFGSGGANMGHVEVRVDYTAGIGGGGIFLPIHARKSGMPIIGM